MTRRTQFSIGLDLLSILFFAAIGRLNHGESILGAPLTAIPFVIGAALAWFVVRRQSGQDPLTVGPGITVWVSTVVVGMILRAILGGGVALSFVIVATLVLGILLVGWRLVLERIDADRAARDARVAADGTADEVSTLDKEDRDIDA